MSKKIRVAIAGVGNCASSLVQGVEYYREQGEKKINPDLNGVMSPDIGGYKAEDLEFVVAFDVDDRKVGKPIWEAIDAKPNCAMEFEFAQFKNCPGKVYMGHPLDGVSDWMLAQPTDKSFRLSWDNPTDVVAALKKYKADVLVNYMPVGSEDAANFYADCALKAKVGFVNCVPVFIADRRAKEFEEAGIPIIGDDIKSQVGATIVHRMLTRLFGDRGYKLKRTYQLNTGGNTDFLNMKVASRLTSKKISKTNAVTSQLDVKMDPDDIHVGPSDYVPWQKDNKVCFIRMEGEGFGKAPIEIELRMSVQDSPNSAGVVIDAIRYIKTAMDKGVYGLLEGPSAYLMKSPPIQTRDSIALDICKKFGRTGKFRDSQIPR